MRLRVRRRRFPFGAGRFVVRAFWAFTDLLSSGAAGSAVAQASRRRRRQPVQYDDAAPPPRPGRGAPRLIRAWIYRFDISSVMLTKHSPTLSGRGHHAGADSGRPAGPSPPPTRADDRQEDADEPPQRPARAGHPRPAARHPDARLRAAQAAQRGARRRSAPLSYGTLYPCLRDLLGRGWIAEATGTTGSSAPPAPSSRRARIVYELTADGKERFQTLVAQSGPAAWEDDNVRRALRLLRPHRGRGPAAHPRGSPQPARGAARRRPRPPPPGAASASTPTPLELQRHGLESAEREVRWLTELIDTERSAGRPPAADSRRRQPRRHRRRPPAQPPAPHHPRLTTIAIPPSEGEPPWDPFASPSSASATARRSLVQGVEYYQDADPSGKRPRADARQVRRLPRQRRRVRRRVRRGRQEGRLRPVRGDQRLARTTPSRSPTSPRPASPCSAATTLDGLGKYYRETIDGVRRRAGRRRPGAQGRQGRRARLLPAGRLRGAPTSSTPSARSTPACAFVNALPVFIASDPEWAAKFEDAGVPIVGDDIKTQVGATITHRVLAKLFEDRGVVLDRTYQLNVGGNMDFKNMLERDRLESKKISKTQAVTSQHRPRPRRSATSTSARRDYVAVARRPQVGLRPPRGSRVRRRAAEPGVQARGLGLPQLGRHHHRRHPRGQDRQGPRHRRRRCCPPRPT